MLNRMLPPLLGSLAATLVAPPGVARLTLVAFWLHPGCRAH